METTRPYPDHDALHDEIVKTDAEIHDAFNAMWDAQGTTDHAERLADYRRLHAYRDGLVRAGVLVSLGPLKEDTNEITR